jgi:Tfp pilus assembly protein PilN
MIRINLLPREIYVQDARRQLRFIGVAVLSSVLVGLLLIYGWQLNIKRREEARNVELSAELRKYQAIVDQVAELEQTRNLLRARRDVIRQLLVGRLIYPKFFEDFMSLLPSEVWVASMSTSLDPQGVMTVTMSAQSLSNFAIADWLTNLQSSPLCSEVKLGAISTQEQGEGKAPVLSFGMSFKYLRKDS